MLARRDALRMLLASTVTASLTFTGAAAVAAGGGGGGGGDTGSVYSDLVVALRAPDGTPRLKEYLVPETDEAAETIEYCVQPASYAAVPGITATVNPLDGRNVWVIPLQGEWIENPVDPLPVAEIEACDPKPQYAMFVSETELERLNLTRTSVEVLARKIKDVETKLTSAAAVSLDPAGRLSADGAALDAAPEYAAIYESLMTTGSVPGLSWAEVPYDAWQLGAVAIGTAASKYVPITVDTVEYYNRVVGFTALDPLPSWGSLSFIQSADPDTTTPMPIDVLPAGENFVDYSDFTYNRSQIYTGAVTWLNVAEMKWYVSPILEEVVWTNLKDTTGLTEEEVNSRPLTGVTAFAQMVDDARAVIAYLHENEVILPGFYMDPVLVDTYDEQMEAITLPAVQLTAPEVAFQTLPFGATSSLFNPWGGTLIDEARVRVTIDAPAALEAGDVTVTSGGVEVPLTASGEDLAGWLGADTGFEMKPGYRMATDFEATVTGAAPSGDFTVTLELVDITDVTTTLASDASTITVQPDALSVLWGGDLPVLGTQGSYYTVPVRAYAPVGQDAVLTFTLTGPDDDPDTQLLEELEAGEAKVFASNGLDMVPMDLSLTAQDQLSGTWPASLNAGYTDLVWYLMVNEGAPVGQYGIDIGVQGGTDLADAAYVSFAAPAVHGQEPPDNGEDTTAPVVMITIDAVTSDTASFSFAANEDGATLETLLAVDGVKGEWEDAATGTRTYTGLEPGDYVFYVKATDLDGNAATYIKKFTIVEPVITPTTPPTTTTPDPTTSSPTTPNPTTSPTTSPAPKGGPSTKVVKGSENRAWVLDKDVTFVLDSDADDATYDVRLNRGQYEEQTGDTVTVEGLKPGMNRIRFRARVRGEVDSTPVVRTVYLPYGVRRTTRTRAWTMLHDRDAFLNTFLSTSRSGQYVSVFAPKVRRIALVVTTGPRSGKVHVYLGSQRLTDKPISLYSRHVVRQHVMTVHRFEKAHRGQIRVVTVGGGGRVKIEGIAIAGK